MGIYLGEEMSKIAYELAVFRQLGYIKVELIVYPHNFEEDDLRDLLADMQNQLHELGAHIPKEGRLT